MKKMMMLLISIVLMSIFAGCGDMLSHYNIRGEHNFRYLTMHEALELLEDESFSGVFYFGFPDCPWCKMAMPAIHEASQLFGIDVFYISRRHSIRGTEGWEEADIEMASRLNDQIEIRWIYEYEEPVRPNIFVPHVIYIREGVVIDHHQGTFEGHYRDENGYLPSLTDEEYRFLLESYIRIFSAVQ